MLDWLGEIIQAALRLVPRVSIIKSTHKGVAFVRGKNIRVVEPGLYVWWPLVTECQFYPVVRQSLDLPTQVLTTEDDLAVIISGVVVYTVNDIKTALTDQWDMNETIRVLSQAALRDVVCSVPFAYINQNRSQVESRLKTALKRELTPYGIDVVDAKLTDFARTNVLAIAGANIGSGIVPVSNNYIDGDGVE